MAEPAQLNVRARTLLGKKVGRLRREGRLPGVVVAHGQDSIPFDTDAHAFTLGYRSWGTTTLLSLVGLSGDSVPALVHGVSRDPRSGKFMHIDMQRVSLTELTHTEVPLHFVGESPAAKGGAVLVHALDHVRVEAFPQDIPHRIDVDLSKLEQLDDALYVRDLIVDGQKVKILNETDELVVKTVAARVEEEIKPIVVAAEGAEPAAEAGVPAAEGAAKAPAAGAAKPGPAAKPGAAPAKP